MSNTSGTLAFMVREETRPSAPSRQDDADRDGMIAHETARECRPWYSRVGMVGLGLLVFAARCFGAEVFPERMCEKLSEVDPDVKAWVGHVAPELSQVPVRELSEKIEIFGRAAAAGWGAIDLFTQPIFREACAFQLPSDALRAVDTAFDFDQLTPISGKDKAGRVFKMRSILAGLGKLLVLTATASSTGTRESIATSGSPHGSSSTAPAAAASRTCTGCASNCCCSGVSRFGPWSRTAMSLRIVLGCSRLSPI